MWRLLLSLSTGELPGKVSIFSLIRVSLSAGFMFLKAFLRLNADTGFLIRGCSLSSKSLFFRFLSIPLSSDWTESLLSCPSSILEFGQQCRTKFDSRFPSGKIHSVYIFTAATSEQKYKALAVCAVLAVCAWLTHIDLLRISTRQSGSLEGALQCCTQNLDAPWLYLNK